MKAQTLFSGRKRKPRYSLFVPFTRPWMVDPWFKNFDKMKMPRKHCELIIYVDSKDREFYQAIKSRIKDQWALAIICFSGLQSPRERGDHTRRSRHVLMRSNSQKLLGDTKYIFGLEDDTLPPLDAFPKLYPTIEKEGIGFVQGTEMDRWGIGCLGAFKLTWRGNKFIASESLPYQDSGLVDIDGGGHYCFIMPTWLYKAIPFKKGPGLISNVDLLHIFHIRQRGYRVLNDFSVKCRHYTQGQVFYPTATNVPVLKRHMTRHGRLTQTVIQPNGKKERGGIVMDGKEIKNLVSVEALGPVFENSVRYSKGQRFLCTRARAISLGKSVRILKEVHDPAMKDFMAPKNTAIQAPITKGVGDTPADMDVPKKDLLCPGCGIDCKTAEELENHKKDCRKWKKLQKQ